MKMPDVITQTYDSNNDFTFRVRVYRELTPQEMRATFFIWNRQRDKRKSLKNKIIEVISIIGYNE
jgi:hypothetical protein